VVNEIAKATGALAILFKTLDTAQLKVSQSHIPFFQHEG
jgi:hypothetical protein